MHNSRLFALVGVGIGVMGLLLKSLRTAGEGLLPTLSQTSGDFPSGIPTIWGGMSVVAQVIIVVLIVAIVAIALRPINEQPMDRTSASVVSVAGLVILGFTLAQWIDAGDKAESLQAGFMEAARADIISAAYTVTTSAGFMILLVGTALVIFGGVMSLRRELSRII